MQEKKTLPYGEVNIITMIFILILIAIFISIKIIVIIPDTVQSSHQERWQHRYILMLSQFYPASPYSVASV